MGKPEHHCDPKDLPYAKYIHSTISQTTTTTLPPVSGYTEYPVSGLACPDLSYSSKFEKDCPKLSGSPYEILATNLYDDCKAINFEVVDDECSKGAILQYLCCDNFSYSTILVSGQNTLSLKSNGQLRKVYGNVKNVYLSCSGIILPPNPPPTTTTTTTTEAPKCTPTITICDINEIELPATLGFPNTPIFKNTNVYLNIGDRVNITVRGCTDCYFNIGVCPSDANGFYGNGTIASNWMVCIGNIDPNNVATKTVSNVTTNPNVFVIGTYLELTANKSGYLYMGIYDGAYDDNYGNYCASIEYLG